MKVRTLTATAGPSVCERFLKTCACTAGNRRSSVAAAIGLSLYFETAQPALEIIDAAIGRSGVALLPRVQVVSSPVDLHGVILGTLERKVVRGVAPSGSTPTHDLYVTFDPTQPFWANLGTAAAEFKLIAVPDDPTIMDLARYPGSTSFGRDIEAALANPRHAGDVALTLLPWSASGTAHTRVASAPLALPRTDEQWAFIVRKRTASTGLVEYAPLASHVEKFSVLSWNTGQYLAFGGALGDLATSIVATDPNDPAMPAHDGFGLPNTWLPPTDPALFGGNAGEDAVAAYLRKARASAEEATAAVKEALEAMLQTQQDQAALAAEVSRSEKVAELERSALCGSSTCTTSMAGLVVSPGAIWSAVPPRTTLQRAAGALVQVPVSRPTWGVLATCSAQSYADMTADRRLDCIARNILSPRVATPVGTSAPWSPPVPLTDFAVSLLEPVVAARNAQTAPSFGEYTGGALQAVAIEQWTALRGVEDRIRAVIGATDAAIGSVDVYKSELAITSEAEAAMKARCDELLTSGSEYAADWSDETFYSDGGSSSLSVSWGGGISFIASLGFNASQTTSTSWSQTPMTEGAKRRLCESYRDKVTSAAWRLQEAVIQASANIRSRAADFSEAMGRLKAASAAGYALQHQADLAVARAKLEVDLLRQSQKTSFGLYRQIHSYDAWRAKSLLEGARLSAAVARKAIESRYVVNLSDLKSPEPLVASPSAWADEVYEYDLDIPAAVGLSVGQSVAGGIYANRMVDYVGNLERFANGYSIARPTSVAHDDTEVVSLPGPAGLDPGALPGTDLPDGRAHAWSYFCPDGPNAGWRPAPPTNGGTKPSETCGPAPAHPTRAALLFALDSWGRFHGDIADEPFEKRYNARWGRLALNLVGTGILDCSKARDPGACYTQPFVRYRLAHRPPSWVTDAEGSWRLMPVPTGRIEAAKALAAEQWLDPISNAWSRPYVSSVARAELTARPFGGSYEIVFNLGPEVVLERISRVQLLVGSSYWVSQGQSFERSPTPSTSNPPMLTATNYDLADTSGGDSITITGTDLGSATSCTVGGTSATITATTNTSLTFTMPAKSAGIYNVQVTTAGGTSNAIPIEAWSPANAASATVLHRWRPDQGVTLVGPKVSQLNDLAGSLHQSQSTDASRFTLVSSDAAYRNKPILSGSSSYMTGATVTAIAAPVSMMVVGELSAGSTAFISAGAYPYNMIWRIEGSNGPRAEFFGVLGPVISDATGTISSPGAVLITDDGSAAGDALKIYTGDPTTPSGTGTKRWNSVTNMNLGHGTAGVGHATGKIAEAMIWSGVLSAPDRTKLDKYVAVRYGL